MDNHQNNNVNDERKQTSRMAAFTELNQVNSDFAIAMALQEQERAVMSTIESESESDIDDDSSDDQTFEFNGYEYFEADFEGQGSNYSDNEMDDDDGDGDAEEDDIDVDELTYEELLALGEFIGEEKRGLTANEISLCLRPCKCPSSSVVVDSKSMGGNSIDRCVICQVEYEEGESSVVVVLPCEHPYHSECISNWLQVKKICPICSTEVSPSKNAKAI